MTRIAIAAAAAIAFAAPAFAHHGWSSYDESKPITVTTSFTRVQWANPHGMAQIRWRGRNWTIVLAPVARMEARGLSAAAVAPGRRLTLTGYPKRDGSAEMRIERIRVAGKTVELR